MHNICQKGNNPRKIATKLSFGVIVFMLINNPSDRIIHKILYKNSMAHSLQ